jgi:hypothetical protein
VLYSILRYLFVVYFALFIGVHSTSMPVFETKRKSDIESKIQNVPFRTSSVPCTLGCLYALLSINHDRHRARSARPNENTESNLNCGIRVFFCFCETSLLLTLALLSWKSSGHQASYANLHVNYKSNLQFDIDKGFQLCVTSSLFTLRKL